MRRSNRGRSTNDNHYTETTRSDYERYEYSGYDDDDDSESLSSYNANLIWQSYGMDEDYDFR